MVRNFSNSTKDILDENSRGTELQLLRSHTKPLVFFGAGQAGVLAYDYFHAFGLTPDFYCDNDPDKKGTFCRGVPVIDFSQLCDQYRESNLFITSSAHLKEIQSQIWSSHLSEFVENGMLHDMIDKNDTFFGVCGFYGEIVKENFDMFERVYNLLFDQTSKDVFSGYIQYLNSGNPDFLLPLRSQSEQYFEKGVIRLGQYEVFIDGGAFTGDTVDEFIKQTGGKFNEVYSFEPDLSKFSVFEKKYGASYNIHLVKSGLWCQKDVLNFNIMSDGSAGNGIIKENSNTGNTVPVISIDEALSGCQATLIKMDIEGSEQEALIGAERTIRKYRPKLAICVYHKPLDIIHIPLYIHQMIPEYKLYLRHYSDNHTETVLYAVAD